MASHSNLCCDQANCGQEASVFALEPPTKTKACRVHMADLMEKYSSVFSIAAYDFIETAEDYSEYMTRRNIAQKCQGALTVLNERCESSKSLSSCRLQIGKQATLEVVERSYQELQQQVEQRYDSIKKHINALSLSLEKFTSSRRYALHPTLEALSKTTPSGALFKVVQGDCSLLLAKTLLEHSVLLPSDEGFPLINTGQQLMEKARSLGEKADLAEEMYTYALELGYLGPTYDFKAAVHQSRKKVTTGLLCVLPLTATEHQKQEWTDLYLHPGTMTRDKSLDWLQQWGINSAEMCLHLGSVLSHLEQKEEVYTLLKCGLQLDPSSLHLRSRLVEAYHQAGEWKRVVEEAETTLGLKQSGSNYLETLQIVYFLTDSHYWLGNITRGDALVDQWTGKTVSETTESGCLLQFLAANKRFYAGDKEEAARLYHTGLQMYEPLFPTAYLTAYTRYWLGWCYKPLNILEASHSNYLKAADIFSACFPNNYHFLTCLNNLAFRYAAMKDISAAEKHYLKAIAIYSTYFAQDRGYAICLSNLATLYLSMQNYSAAETHYLRAIAVYSAFYPQNPGLAFCLSNLGDLLRRVGRKTEAIERIEGALQLYLHNNAQEDVTICQAKLQELRK